MNIGELVQDWGGFEKLVASLHETGDVIVEHNVVLTGRSGAKRQIDVLIRHKQGLYEHLVVAECKYWNSSVERLHVDALATTIKEVGADKGVIFSTKGFQSGAITQAAHENIDLFAVRDLTDREWGLPGRVFDMYLHINAVSLGHFEVRNAFTLPGMAPSSGALNLSLGNPASDTRTPAKIDGADDKTIEEFVLRMARESAQKVYVARAFKIGEGDEGDILARTKVNVASAKPISIFCNGGTLFIPAMSFDIGLTISQSRIVIDRANNYVFSLAVEDCVRRKVTAASRKLGEGSTTLVDIIASESVQDENIFKNGSLLTVWLKGFHQFDAFDGIEYGQFITRPPIAR